MNWLIAMLLVMTAQPVLAEVIEFQEDELASESVLPKFDQPTATKKRIVPTEGRFEAEVHGGTSLSDAFFNIYPIGVQGSYHLNEFSALELRADFYLNSVTSYKQDLINTYNKNNITQQRLDRNPASQYSVMGGYEFTPYYGKISITKSKVINLSIIASADVGVINFADGTTPVVSLNIGEKFYFSPNWGIRADLRTMLYNGTDVIYDPPDKRLMTNVLISIGALYLFPGL